MGVVLSSSTEGLFGNDHEKLSSVPNELKIDYWTFYENCVRTLMGVLQDLSHRSETVGGR